MSDTTMITLATIFASVISVGITSLVTYLINKYKAPVEVQAIKADTSLTGSEIAAKYQAIANSQADQNIELGKNNLELKKQIEVLQNDVEELKAARITDREEFRKTFEEERAKNQKILDEERKRADKFEAYNGRLLLQLGSWEIIPVPWDLISFKDEMSNKKCIDGSDMGSK